MNAFRTILTVSDPHQVVVDNVPFSVGQQVEVIVLPATKSANRELEERLRQLLKETQALPQIQSISDADIQAEVSAHRSGQ